MAEFKLYPIYGDKLPEALALAARLHNKQVRKDNSPYLFHLTGVMEIVGTHGGSTDQMCAALLHDAVEDIRFPLEAINLMFGNHVESMVRALTAPDLENPFDYNEAYAASVRKVPESILVSAADKLNNLRGYAKGGAVFRPRHKHLYEIMMPIYRENPIMDAGLEEMVEEMEDLLEVIEVVDE